MEKEHNENNQNQLVNQAVKIMDVLDSAAMGVWRVTLCEGKAPRESASPKMLELLGLERDGNYTEEEIYKAWQEGICPEARDSVDRSVAKMIEGTYDENTYKWNHPKWGIRYMRCGGIGYKDEDGNQIIEGYHYDVTKYKLRENRMLAELKENIEANKAKTVMLQNMTHEIRTPLNALYGFSQLLCMPDGSYTEEEKSEFYSYINNSFNMLSMIVDDVLDLTDVEHGNYRVQISRFKVNRVCRDSIQMAELRKQGRVKMYFTSELDDGHMIESDCRRIQQVLVNLLTNACKHTIQGEIHLHLSATENQGHLTFSVTDTGEGIPVDKAKEIFMRYKKANNLVQGSGLGLHICCTIAKKLGAEIRLDESYKDGARFLFIL